MIDQRLHIIPPELRGIGTFAQAPFEIAEALTFVFERLHAEEIAKVVVRDAPDLCKAAAKNLHPFAGTGSRGKLMDENQPTHQVRELEDHRPPIGVQIGRLHDRFAAWRIVQDREWHMAEHRIRTTAPERRAINEIFRVQYLSLIHISEPTRLLSISYAV